MSESWKGARKRRRPIAYVVLSAMVLGLILALGASATSLPGSNFEIDTPSANLTVDGAAPPALDWANVNEARQADLPSGAGDNSFGNGTKEDTPVPTVTSGSIPPQKSDLKTFGAYLETTASGARFLNLFWNRVQEPNGTTNMDFELNQSSVASANGVTPVRTAGDLLIQYDLSRGGTNPTLWLSRWVTSGATSQCEANNALPCWGTKSNLTAAGDATGSIRPSPITAANSDGLGAMSARTFGEAQIDFDALSGGAGTCTAFGSAYLKSRSSDAFTSEIKDFIAPEAVNIAQCATVIIRKQTDPDGSLQKFDYTKAFSTSPSSANTFQLADGENYTKTNVLGGTNYTVTEDALPAGWSFDHLDCSASVGVTPTIDSALRKVTFNIDSASDVLDCTYYNNSLGTIIVKKVTSDGMGAFDFTGNLPDAAFTLTTTGPGEAGSDSNTYANIPTGSYNVAETVPAGWNLTSSTCDDGSLPSAIGLDVNETVTCTFTNARERGTIIVEKITDNGSGSFDYTSTTLPETAFTLTTTGAGAAGKDANTYSGLLASSLAGNYDVAETVPSGWNLVSQTCDDGSPVGAINLADGETVTCTFHNARQTGAIDITKLRKHAALGAGDWPHAGVTFTVTGGELPAAGIAVVTDLNGEACVSGLLLSSFAGDYTVTETVPNGYHVVGGNSQTATVTSEATCSTGSRPELTFHNMPLTDLTVSVNSQVDGGTASHIECDTSDPADEEDTGLNGDGSLSVMNLEPGVYTCVITVDP